MELMTIPGGTLLILEPGSALAADANATVYDSAGILLEKCRLMYIMLGCAYYETERTRLLLMFYENNIFRICIGCI